MRIYFCTWIPWAEEEAMVLDKGRGEQEFANRVGKSNVAKNLELFLRQINGPLVVAI
jgi:hypothetical protein